MIKINKGLSIEILKAFGIFLLGVLIVVFTAKITDWSSKSNTVTLPPEVIEKIVEKPRTIVECPSDFSSYEKTSKKVILATNVISYGVPNTGLEGGKFEGGQRISLKRTGLQSKIACGYLFYRASSGNKPLDQKYMNLYMGAVDPNGGVQFGGHILPDKKTEIINRNIDGKTEILLPLNDIPYDGKSRNNIFQADWSTLLNVSDQINFFIALNTVEKNGTINLVEIAYKCWNPKTGEETEDCELTIE